MEKPEECAICYLKLDEEKNPLECGHWMHIACVQKHFKPECPLCRQPLNIKVNGTKPGADLNLFAPPDQDEEEEEVVQGFGFFMNLPRGILRDVVEHNFDDDENSSNRKRRHDEPWRAKGYQYREEDSEYDEENPRGDNWEYEDV